MVFKCRYNLQSLKWGYKKVPTVSGQSNSNGFTVEVLWTVVDVKVDGGIVEICVVNIVDEGTFEDCVVCASVVNIVVLGDVEAKNFNKAIRKDYPWLNLSF